MFGLVRIEVGPVCADGALGVAHRDIADPCRLTHFAYPYAGGAGAVHHDLELVETLVGQLGIVHDTCQAYYRRAPLVIVENRNVQLGIKAVLDFKACWRGDVLKVHAAILRSDGLDRRYHALRVRLA